MDIPIHVEWLKKFLQHQSNSFRLKNKYSREIRPEVYAKISEYQPYLNSFKKMNVFEPQLYSLALFAIDSSYKFNSSTFQTIIIFLQKSFQKINLSINDFQSKNYSNYDAYDKLSSNIMLLYIRNSLKSTPISTEIASNDYFSYESSFEQWVRQVIGDSTMYKSDFIDELRTAQIESIILSKIRPDLIQLNNISFGCSISQREAENNWREIEVALFVLGMRIPTPQERADKLCLICLLSDIYIVAEPILKNSKNKEIHSDNFFQHKILSEPNQADPFQFSPSPCSYLQKIDDLLSKVNELAKPVWLENKQNSIQPLLKPVNLMQSEVKPSNNSFANEEQNSVSIMEKKKDCNQTDNFETELQIIRHKKNKSKQGQNEYPKAKVEKNQKNSFEENDDESDDSFIEAKKIPQRILNAKKQKDFVAPSFRVKKEKKNDSIPIAEQRQLFKKLKDFMDKKGENDEEEEYREQIKQSPIRNKNQKQKGSFDPSKIVKPKKEGQLFSEFKLSEQVKAKRQKIQSKKPEQDSNSPLRQKKSVNNMDNSIEYDKNMSSSFSPPPQKKNSKYPKQPPEEERHSPRKQKNQLVSDKVKNKKLQQNNFDEEYDTSLQQHPIKDSKKQINEPQNNQNKHSDSPRKKNEGSYYENYQKRKQLLEKDQQREEKQRKQSIKNKEKRSNSPIKSKIPTKSDRSKKSALQEFMDEKENDSIQKKHLLYQKMVPNFENNDASLSQNSDLIPLEDSQKQLKSSKKDSQIKNSNSKQNFKSLLESSSVLKPEKNTNSGMKVSDTDRYNKLLSKKVSGFGSSSLKSFIEIERRLNEQKSSLSSTKNIIKSENESQIYNNNDIFEEEEEEISRISQDTASFRDENDYNDDYRMNSNDSYQRKQVKHAENESFISEYDINSLKNDKRIESSSKMPSSAEIDDSLLYQSGEENSFSIPNKKDKNYSQLSQDSFDDLEIDASQKTQKDKNRRSMDNSNSNLKKSNYRDSSSKLHQNSDSFNDSMNPNKKSRNQMNSSSLHKSTSNQNSNDFDESMNSNTKSSNLKNSSSKLKNSLNSQKSSIKASSINDKKSSNLRDSSSKIRKLMNSRKTEDLNNSNSKLPKLNNSEKSIDNSYDEKMENDSELIKKGRDQNESKLKEELNKLDFLPNFGSSDSDSFEDPLIAFGKIGVSSSDILNEEHKSNKSTEKVSQPELSISISDNEPTKGNNDDSIDIESGIENNNNEILGNEEEEIDINAHISIMSTEEEEDDDDADSHTNLESTEEEKVVDIDSQTISESAEEEKGDDIGSQTNSEFAEEEKGDNIGSQTNSEFAEEEEENNAFLNNDFINDKKIPSNNNADTSEKHNSASYSYSYSYSYSNSKLNDNYSNQNSVINSNENSAIQNNSSENRNEQQQNSEEQQYNSNDNTEEQHNSNENSEEQHNSNEITEEQHNSNENSEEEQHSYLNSDEEQQNSNANSEDEPKNLNENFDEEDEEKNSNETSVEQHQNSSKNSEPQPSSDTNSNEDSNQQQAQEENSVTPETTSRNNSSSASKDNPKENSSKKENNSNNKSDADLSFSMNIYSDDDGKNTNENVDISISIKEEEEEIESDNHRKKETNDQVINNNGDDSNGESNKIKLIKNDDDEDVLFSLIESINSSSSDEENNRKDEEIHNQNTNSYSYPQSDNSDFKSDKSKEIVNIKSSDTDETKSNESKENQQQTSKNSKDKIEIIDFSFSDSSDKEEKENVKDEIELFIEEEEEDSIMPNESQSNKTDNDNEIENKTNENNTNKGDELSSSSLNHDKETKDEQPLKKDEDLLQSMNENVTSNATSNTFNKDPNENSDKDNNLAESKNANEAIVDNKEEDADSLDDDAINIEIEDGNNGTNNNDIVEDIDISIDDDEFSKSDNNSDSLGNISFSDDDNKDIVNDTEAPTVILTKIPFSGDDNQKTAPPDLLLPNNQENSEFPSLSDPSATINAAPIQKETGKEETNDKNDDLIDLSIISDKSQPIQPNDKNDDLIELSIISDKSQPNDDSEISSKTNNNSLNKTETPTKPNLVPKSGDTDKNSLSLSSKPNDEAPSITPIEFGDEFLLHQNSIFDMTPTKQSEKDDQIIKSQTLITATLQNENEFSSIEPKIPKSGSFTNDKEQNANSIIGDSLYFSDDNKNDHENNMYDNQNSSLIHNDKNSSDLDSSGRDELFNSVITLPNELLNSMHSQKSEIQSNHSQNGEKKDNNVMIDIEISDLSLGTQNLQPFEDGTENLQKSQQANSEKSSKIELSGMPINTDKLPQFDENGEKGKSEETPNDASIVDTPKSPKIESFDEGQNLIISSEIIIPNEEEDNESNIKSSSTKQDKSKNLNLSFTDIETSDADSNKKPDTRTESGTETYNTNFFRNKQISSPTFIESSKIQFKGPPFDLKNQNHPPEKTGAAATNSETFDHANSPDLKYPLQIQSPVETQHVTFDSSLVKASRKDFLNQPVQIVDTKQRKRKEDVPLSQEQKEMISNYLSDVRGENKEKYQTLSQSEEKVLLKVLPDAENAAQHDLYDEIANELNIPRNDPITHKIMSNITTFLGNGKPSDNPLSKTSTIKIPSSSIIEEEDDDSDYF